MRPKNNLDRFRDVIFDDSAVLLGKGFLPVEIEQIKRYRFAFSMYLETPSITDRTLVNDMVSNFGISMSQAYRDIANVKIILPSVKNAGREWIRYLVTEELKEIIEYTKRDDLSKAKYIDQRIAALDKLAKYNKLNQPDEIDFNWENIVPIPIEPTNDVSVLGVKPLENKEEFIRKMYEKYKGEIDIEDIVYQDVNDNNDE